MLEVVAGRIEAQAQLEEDRRELARRLFGPVVPAGADPVAAVVTVALWRDGLARALRCSQAEAVGLLDAADAAGDDQLARALCAVAVQRGWIDVIEAFVAANPDSDVDLDVLLPERTC